MSTKGSSEAHWSLFLWSSLKHPEDKVRITVKVITFLWDSLILTLVLPRLTVISIFLYSSLPQKSLHKLVLQRISHSWWQLFFLAFFLYLASCQGEVTASNDFLSGFPGSWGPPYLPEGETAHWGSGRADVRPCGQRGQLSYSSLFAI